MHSFLDISTSWFFNGWDPIIKTLIVGTLTYIALIFSLRITGKRTLTKMNSFDFIITVSFGSTVATILLSNTVSLTQGITALTLLILLQYVITKLSVYSPVFQKLIKARPSLLFYKGKYLHEEMKKARITKGELQSKAREKGYQRMEDIDAIVLETEGSLTLIGKLDDGSVTTMENVRNYK